MMYPQVAGVQGDGGGLRSGPALPTTRPTTALGTGVVGEAGKPSGMWGALAPTGGAVARSERVKKVWSTH